MFYLYPIANLKNRSWAKVIYKQAHLHCKDPQFQNTWIAESCVLLCELIIVEISDLVVDHDSSYKSLHTALPFVSCLYKLKALVPVLVLAILALYLFDITHHHRARILPLAVGLTCYLYPRSRFSHQTFSHSNFQSNWTSETGLPFSSFIMTLLIGVWTFSQSRVFIIVFSGCLKCVFLAVWNRLLDLFIFVLVYSCLLCASGPARWKTTVFN